MLRANGMGCRTVPNLETPFSNLAESLALKNLRVRMQSAEYFCGQLGHGLGVPTRADQTLLQPRYKPQGAMGTLSCFNIIQVWDLRFLSGSRIASRSWEAYSTRTLGLGRNPKPAAVLDQFEPRFHNQTVQSEQPAW